MACACPLRLYFVAAATGSDAEYAAIDSISSTGAGAARTPSTDPRIAFAADATALIVGARALLKDRRLSTVRIALAMLHIGILAHGADGAALCFVELAREASRRRARHVVKSMER